MGCRGAKCDACKPDKFFLGCTLAQGMLIMSIIFIILGALLIALLCHYFWLGGYFHYREYEMDYPEDFVANATGRPPKNELLRAEPETRSNYGNMTYDRFKYEKRTRRIKFGFIICLCIIIILVIGLILDIFLLVALIMHWTKYVKFYKTTLVCRGIVLLVIGIVIIARCHGGRRLCWLLELWAILWVAAIGLLIYMTIVTCSLVRYMEQHPELDNKLPKRRVKDKSEKRAKKEKKRLEKEKKKEERKKEREKKDRERKGKREKEKGEMERKKDEAKKEAEARKKGGGGDKGEVGKPTPGGGEPAAATKSEGTPKDARETTSPTTEESSTEEVETDDEDESDDDKRKPTSQVQQRPTQKSQSARPTKRDTDKESEKLKANVSRESELSAAGKAPDTKGEKERAKKSGGVTPKAEGSSYDAIPDRYTSEMPYKIRSTTESYTSLSESQWITDERVSPKPTEAFLPDESETSLPEEGETSLPEEGETSLPDEGETLEAKPVAKRTKRPSRVDQAPPPTIQGQYEGRSVNEPGMLSGRGTTQKRVPRRVSKGDPSVSANDKPESNVQRRPIPPMARKTRPKSQVGVENLNQESNKDVDTYQKIPETPQQRRSTVESEGISNEPVAEGASRPTVRRGPRTPTQQTTQKPRRRSVDRGARGAPRQGIGSRPTPRDGGGPSARGARRRGGRSDPRARGGRAPPPSRPPPRYDDASPPSYDPWPPSPDYDRRYDPMYYDGYPPYYDPPPPSFPYYDEPSPPYYYEDPNSPYFYPGYYDRSPPYYDDPYNEWRPDPYYNPPPESEPQPRPYDPRWSEYAPEPNIPDRTQGPPPSENVTTRSEGQQTDTPTEPAQTTETTGSHASQTREDEPAAPELSQAPIQEDQPKERPVEEDNQSKVDEEEEQLAVNEYSSIASRQIQSEPSVIDESRNIPPVEDTQPSASNAGENKPPEQEKQPQENEDESVPPEENQQQLNEGRRDLPKPDERQSSPKGD